MPQVFLPAEHTDADIILASRIADAVDSAELFVTWTRSCGAAVPVIHAHLRPARRPLAEALRAVGRGLADVWRRGLATERARA